jgi:hypothetical protein
MICTMNAAARALRTDVCRPDTLSIRYMIAERTREAFRPAMKTKSITAADDATPAALLPASRAITLPVTAVMSIKCSPDRASR